MKKFKFKLQKILDIREAEEKEIQYELAEAVGKQNILKVKQQEYRNKVLAQKNIYHDKMGEGTVDFLSMMNFQRFVDFTDKYIKSSQAEIESMQPAIDEIRSRLIEATKKKRTLEKLKERQKEKWDEVLKKSEEKEQDDINQKIYMRKYMMEYAND